MYIILVRHGEAEPETDKVSNRSRRLTDKGRRQVKKSAELLKKLLGNQPPYRLGQPLPADQGNCRSTGF